MSPAPSPSRRRSARPTVWVAIGAIALGGGFGATAARAHEAGTPSFAFCPPAKRLVTPQTSWHRHRLAAGIHFSAAVVDDGAQHLKVNVLRVNLRSQRVKVAPLHRRLSSRRPLTRLAHRRHLVAATNASYFDFGYGAPTVPVIGHGEPLVMTRRHTGVAGIGFDGKMRYGKVWLVGRARSPHGSKPIVGLNAVSPPRGLSLYTSHWGGRRVPLPRRARTLPLRHGRAVDHVDRRLHVPRHGGQLLVATTSRARRWLHKIHRGNTVTVGYHAVATAHHAFQQAYGVGTHVVGHHQQRTDLYCRRSEIYAARTDIAWTDHGRRMILATVDSPRGASGYGVDENQMSQIMAAIGAGESYALDGGGSTELLAKLPSQPQPSIRTHNHRERPIPVGIGVYALPKPHHAHHHKHKQPKPAKPGNPLGGLLGGLLGGG